MYPKEPLVALLQLFIETPRWCSSALFPIRVDGGSCRLPWSFFLLRCTLHLFQSLEKLVPCLLCVLHLVLQAEPDNSSTSKFPVSSVHINDFKVAYKLHPQINYKLLKSHPCSLSVDLMYRCAMDDRWVNKVKHLEGVGCMLFQLTRKQK